MFAHLIAKRAARERRRGYQPRFESLEDRSCPALVAPTGLQTVVDSPTQATLSWGDVADEAGYRVLRWDGERVLEVASVAADVTTYTVTGLVPGQKAWLAVQAYAGGSSAQSDWLGTDMPAEPLTVPFPVGASQVGTRGLTLTWGDSEGETGYRVFLWDGSKARLIGSRAANQTTFAVSGLAPLTTYYFYVEAFNSSNTAATDWKGVTTTREPIGTPAIVSALVASATTVTVKWGDVAGETGYRVVVWDGAKLSLRGTVGANVTSYTAGNLAAGKTYSFFVQAFNPTNAASSSWKAVTMPIAPLTAPGSLAGRKVSSTGVELTWSKANRPAGYQVLLWNGSAWRAVVRLSADTTRAVVAGLTPGRTYFFMVQSYTAGFADVANSKSVFVNL